MVPFRWVDVHAEIAEEVESDVLQLHGRLEGFGKEAEVVYEWEQPSSRQSLSSANPPFLRFARLSGSGCRLEIPQLVYEHFR